MKRLALLVGLVFVLSTGVAQASRYYLGYGQGKRATMEFEVKICNQLSGCYKVRVPTCRRRSASRIDCLAASYYRQGTICTEVVIKRVNSQGYLIQSTKNLDCR